MYYNNLGLFIAVAIIAVIFGAILIDETIQRYKGKGIKSAPPYCWYCGCPTKEIWIRQWKEFDPMTGMGTAHERLYYQCSKDKWHYNKKSVYKRTASIEAECTPSYFPKDDTLGTMP